MDKIKVYYNSACPVCATGIRDQRCRMETQEIDGMEWIDVHANPDSVRDVGSDLETIRERLHVRDVDGTVRVGTDAFAVLFSRTRGQRWLGRLLLIPGIRQVGQVLYNRFARWLYVRNLAKGRW